jgi:hypothetical protein
MDAEQTIAEIEAYCRIGMSAFFSVNSRESTVSDFF